ALPKDRPCLGVRSFLHGRHNRRRRTLDHPACPAAEAHLSKHTNTCAASPSASVLVRLFMPLSRTRTLLFLPCFERRQSRFFRFRLAKFICDTINGYTRATGFFRCFNDGSTLAFALAFFAPSFGGNAFLPGFPIARKPLFLVRAAQAQVVQSF